MPLLELIGIISLTLVVVYLALRKANDDKPYLGIELFDQSGQIFENPRYSLKKNTKGIDSPFVNVKYGFGNDPILGEEEWIMNETHKTPTHQNPPAAYEGLTGRSNVEREFRRFGNDGLKPYKKKGTPSVLTGRSDVEREFKRFGNNGTNIFGDKPCKCDRNFR